MTAVIIIIVMIGFAAGLAAGLLIKPSSARPGETVPHTAESLGSGIGLSAETVRGWRMEGRL